MGVGGFGRGSYVLNSENKGKICWYFPRAIHAHREKKLLENLENLEKKWINRAAMVRCREA